MPNGIIKKIRLLSRWVSSTTHITVTPNGIIKKIRLLSDDVSHFMSLVFYIIRMSSLPPPHPPPPLKLHFICCEIGGSSPRVEAKNTPSLYGKAKKISFQVHFGVDLWWGGFISTGGSFKQRWRFPNSTLHLSCHHLLIKNTWYLKQKTKSNLILSSMVIIKLLLRHLLGKEFEHTFFSAIQRSLSCLISRLKFPKLAWQNGRHTMKIIGMTCVMLCDLRTRKRKKPLKRSKGSTKG